MNLIRKDTAEQYRNIRKILRRDISEPSFCEESSMTTSSFMAKVGFVMLILGAVLIGRCQVAHAYILKSKVELNEQKAIQIIVGEAANQGLIGMTCVAEVIRHKGSLRGFYGFHASHSAHEPKWVWKQAKKAWYASKTTNLTKYANHFENIHAFGCPFWVRNCVLTFEYKDHKFYKEI